MAAYYNLAPGAFFQRMSAVWAQRVTPRDALHCGAIATQVWSAIRLLVLLLWALAALGFLLLTMAGFLAG